MSTTHTRAADELNRAFRRLGAHTDVEATGDGVRIPASTAQRAVAALGFSEGGARVPFVRSLLHRPDRSDVVLRGDEGLHLARALNDIEREADRRRRIDRGQIPGAMSGSEVARLARKHPHMFGGRRG